MIYVRDFKEKGRKRKTWVQQKQKQTVNPLQKKPTRGQLGKQAII